MGLEKNIKQEIATISRDITYPAFGGVLRQNDATLAARGGHLGIGIYDEIERDGRAFSVLRKRRLAVIKEEWTVDAASDSAADMRAADIVREQLAALPFDTICEQLLDAILKGYTVAEIIWDTKDGKVIAEQVLAKDQRRFQFADDGSLLLKTPDNMYPGMPVPDRKFIVHRVGQKFDTDAYGRGLGSVLFWPIFFKKEGIRFWVTFADKFGSPTSIGKYPTGADDAAKRALLSALESIAQDAGVIVPEGMAIELLEATRSGSITTYSDLVKYLDEEISVIVLGESLTTSIQGDGSRAATEVHDDVRRDLAQADSDLLSATLNNTLVRWISEMNVPGATPPTVWREITTDDRQRMASLAVSLYNTGARFTPAYYQRHHGLAEDEFTVVDPTLVPPMLQFAADIETAIDAVSADEQDDIMEPLLAPIIRMIRDAASYDDVIARLHELVGADTSDRDFREMLSKAIFAASLSGGATE